MGTYAAQPLVPAQLDTCDMFRWGYRVLAEPGRTFGSFRVINPAGVGYLVRPLDVYCSCPDSRRHNRACKHLKNLFSLLRDSWCEVNDDPAQEAAMFALVEEMDAVAEMLAERRTHRRAA